MSAVKSPLNTAHQHAANADDYKLQGLLIPAAEEHHKAAEAFMACIEQSNDENAKRTLRMLYNEHQKAGKELQRKIVKLREENKDPTMPQKASSPGTNTPTTSAATIRYAHHPSPSPPPHGRGFTRLADSQNNVDESFMVLGQRSDPGDAFNNFWKIMEGMLDNLSQPVAFATAPLGTELELPAKKIVRRDGSMSSDTDIENITIPRTSKKARSDKKLKSKQHLITFEETDEEVLADEDDELSESFCVIPSGSDPSPSSLKKDNTAMKLEVVTLQRRLAATEKVLQLRKDQDQQLRDSIVMAKHQAQRAMGASMIQQQRPGQAVDLASLNINLPAVPSPMTALNTGRDREAQLLRRIRELEEEVRAARTENDKQKVVIAKFRDRWEKLKESAKRKKDAKAAVEVAKIGIRERIEEEPEGDFEES